MKAEGALEALNFFGSKVVRLPERGVLLVATDLQGNWEDYCAMKALYAAEEAAGREPVLLFCGDMVHGPNSRLNEPGGWPPFLGSEYVDRSADILRDFMVFSTQARTFSLLGNHEHAHVGGPVVSKFHPDEAEVLRQALGEDVEAAESFMATWPLIALSRSGLVFVHASPAATMAHIDDYEGVDYGGYEGLAPIDMLRRNEPYGILLWARSATEREAQRFLDVSLPERRGDGVVCFGHDVVRSGWRKVGARQLCISTSFGLNDEDKVYLRIALAGRYRTTDALREGVEICKLYGVNNALE